MAIIYHKEKREIAPWISGVTIVATLAIVVHALLPEAPKREGVLLSSTALAMLARGEVARRDMSLVVVQQEAQRETPVTIASPPSSSVRPLPPFGTDAIGAPGAWDGRSEDGLNDSNNGDIRLRDYSGQPCLDYFLKSEIPTATLRALLPSPDVADNCKYRMHYVTREGVSASDVLTHGSMLVYGAKDIKGFYKSGLWSTTDFEKLARFELRELGIVTLYLIPKNAGSPAAEELRNRVASSESGELLNDFLKQENVTVTARWKHFAGINRWTPNAPAFGFLYPASMRDSFLSKNYLNLCGRTG